MLPQFLYLDELDGFLKEGHPYVRGGTIDCFWIVDDLAGPEGIEPPLELLESSGLPLTYGPSNEIISCFSGEY